MRSRVLDLFSLETMMKRFLVLGSAFFLFFCGVAF